MAKDKAQGVDHPALRIDDTDRTGIARLLAIMAALRDPKTGCPWDIEQDFATIAPYTIEEAHEVADAITRKAWGELPGELGDLLLQVVFHAQMADEAGMFGFAALAELVLIDLLIPWERFGRYADVRWVVFGLGVYGVLWVVMYVVGQHMYPHLIRDDELELRNGHFAVARIPRAALRDARPRPLRDAEEDRVVLSDPLAPANLDLDFTEAVAVRGMLGSVCYSVLHKTNVPVLIVK